MAILKCAISITQSVLISTSRNSPPKSLLKDIDLKQIHMSLVNVLVPPHSAAWSTLGTSTSGISAKPSPESCSARHSLLMHGEGASFSQCVAQREPPEAPIVGAQIRAGSIHCQFHEPN